MVACWSRMYLQLPVEQIGKHNHCTGGILKKNVVFPLAVLKMFGVVFLNEKMGTKMSHFLLNDNKDFPEGSLLLTNHRRRGVDFS